MASLGDCSEKESNNPSTDDETEQQLKLVAKKNTKSKVWKYFGFTPNEDGSPSDSDTPKCRLCLKDVSARWSSTSNLLNHLKLHHISEYREILHEQSSTVLSRKDKFKQTGSKRSNSVLKRYRSSVAIVRNIEDLLKR